MELYTSNVYYNGKTYNDCFAFCKYETELNDIIQFLLDESAAVCNLAIPTCITVTSNTTSNILQALLTKACEAKVRVSTTDTCLGWLKDKITSTDGTVAITFPIDGSGCQSIDLSVTPATVDTSIVKFNSNTSSTASGDGSAFKIVNIPAGTLVTNGSSLLLNFDVLLNRSDANVTYTMLINGTALQIVSIYPGEIFTLGNLRINRVNSTTVYVSGTTEIYATGLARKIGVFNNSFTVNDLDSIVNTFTLKTGTIAIHLVTMTNRFFTMDKFIK